MQSGKRLVEADWTLLHTCNYRCEYCFVPRSMLGEKIRIRASNEEWAEAFDRHDVKWHIHITGGEPTAYPDFAGLCEHLTINNLISLNSNLTGKSLENFVKRINPERVVFYQRRASLHGKKGRSGLEDFLTRARQLTDSGFNLMISAVMTPEFITIAEAVRQRLMKNGIIMAPKILRGNFSGRVWPHAYSKDQRKLIFRFLDLAERELERLQDRGGHQLTIDLRLDRTLLGEGAGFIYKLRDTFSKTAALEKCPWQVVRGWAQLRFN